MSKEPITITLSEKTIRIVDHLSDISEFGSRSRTIEEVILSFDQVVQQYGFSYLLSKDGMTDQEVHKILFNQIMVILERLNVVSNISTILQKNKFDRKGR